MKIELEDKIVDVLAKLRAQAASQQLSFEAYLEQFVEADSAAANGLLSTDDFDAVLDEIAAAPISAPSLPADFSRADVYASHD